MTVKLQLHPYYYSLAHDLTLELQTNVPAAGISIGRFLFPKKLNREKPSVAKIRLIWNGQTMAYEFSCRGSKRVSAKKLPSLFPHIDYEAKRFVMKHLPNYIMPVHSAGAVKRGKAILLIGKSMSGKSRALLELIQKGYSPLSDEVNFIDLRCFRVYPYYRSLGLDEPIPKKILKKPHAEFFVHQIVNNKIKKTGRHLYLPLKSLGKQWPKKPSPLSAVFLLETWRSKRCGFKRFNDVTLMKILMENDFMYSYLKSRSKRFSQKYSLLLVKLFKRFPKYGNTIKGYGLRIKKQHSFSQLIDNIKLT